MNGPIAQLVALTCHGNAFLSGQESGALFPNNSTFAFCDRVSFVGVERAFLKKAKEVDIANDPDEWFTWLKASGARGIRLSRTPHHDPIFSDRITAGLIGGGGTWAMQALFPKNRGERWVARWTVWNQNAAENRIWRVVYGRVASGVTSTLEPDNLREVIDRLGQRLREIRTFSEKHGCDVFTECFAKALDTLDSKGNNLHGYHQDLAPAGFLSGEATAILDAAQSAWVFGGMASWNDLGFEGEDQKEYERVSNQLFQAVNEAIAVAANSTYPRFLAEG